jgi:DNA helicase-2/ATP-dependent DNA helicase PcrA
MINPRSDVDLLRVINSPPRGIGDATVERLTAYAAGEGICLYDAIAPEELSLITDLNAAARNRLAGFRTLLEELIAVAAGTAGDAAQAAVTLSGLEQRLADLDTEEAEDRLGNLKEFVQAAGEFDVRQADLGPEPAEPGADGASDRTALVQFLEEVSLLGDADGEGGEADGQDRVSVMTLHAAKGLEFNTVVMLGMEEGIFPHARALKPMAEPDEMEEERRLCYVGITRAKRRLILSCAQCRILFGEFRRNRVSRFLEDIPTELFERPPPRLVEPAPTGRHIDYSYDQTFRPAPTYYPRAAAPRRAPQRRVSTLSSETGTGNLVRHPTFGLGRVVAADGEGPDAKLTVVFNSGATKRLVARFVQPA